MQNVLACAFGAIKLICFAKSLLLSCENRKALWFFFRPVFFSPIVFHNDFFFYNTFCNKKTAGYFSDFLVNRWLRWEMRECKSTRQLVGRCRVLSLCFQYCHTRWVCILKILCVCVCKCWLRDKLTLYPIFLLIIHWELSIHCVCLSMHVCVLMVQYVRILQ